MSENKKNRDSTKRRAFHVRDGATMARVVRVGHGAVVLHDGAHIASCDDPWVIIGGDESEQRVCFGHDPDEPVAPTPDDEVTT